MAVRTQRVTCAFELKSSITALMLAVGAAGCANSSAGDGPPEPSAQPTAGNNSAMPGSGGNQAGSGTGGMGGMGGSGAPGGAGTGVADSDGGAGKPGGIPIPGLGGIVPLFDATTKLEPAVVENTPDALITHWADRARDRHAREDQFKIYEHYLHIYWENRIAEVEIVDKVGKGGGITFNVKTLWKLDDKQAELRFFFRGIGTVAEYNDNKPMTPVGTDNLHYTRTVTNKMPENRPLQVGDKMEFELSQFLDKNFNGGLVGRDNYYGTVMLYIAGKGLVPWIGSGERRDSNPVPEEAWLGGHTTVHVNESDEPVSQLIQLAGNIAPQNGQRFVLGRRAIHTNFDDGHHDESPENPSWTEQAGKLGPLYINHSCAQCHFNNGRAVPPAVGTPLNKYVIKVGNEDGSPDAKLGGVLQPADAKGEPSVNIASWTEQNGLRKPNFAFTGTAPAHFSPRISPQLVGMGLLEAIPETAIAANADPNDANGDGISGRMRVVTDPVTGDKRLGRFGWKAGQAMVRYQSAGALRTDMGVLTSVFPTPDCGSAEQNCGASAAELNDTDLGNLSAYVSLLGIRPQRNWADAAVIKGKAVFMSTGCGNCHTPKFETSPYAPFAELRSQTIQPFTDLLLHDMGPGLADTLPEGDASYSEWRTPPLWSIGLTAGVSGGEAYLHDGRARTLAEAILWHGGEGEKAKNAFSALAQGDKDALLAFLKSL